jgi:hypothetical protein
MRCSTVLYCSVRGAYQMAMIRELGASECKSEWGRDKCQTVTNLPQRDPCHSIRSKVPSSTVQWYCTPTGEH